MRHRLKLLICIFVVSITVHYFGTNLVAYKSEDYSQKQNETEALDTQYFLELETLIGDSSFGGVVFEEDVLIINIVKDTNFDKSKIDQINGQKMDIRDVKYSLSFLEENKDFLTKYMDGGEILALDANEATNTVDIYLSTYNHNLISEMSDDVQKRFTENEYLNFIDYSGRSIQSTVAYEKPNYRSISQDFYASPQSPYNILPMFMLTTPIKIGSGYYTLGPAKSTTNAYSAGHGFTNTAQVYSALTPTLRIGTAKSNFGGGSGDWSSITAASSITFSPSLSARNAKVGDTVYMFGAVSGITQGKVTSTNTTLYFPPFAPLTGMYSGDYICKLGDSGAGILNKNNISNPSSTYNYGVQSSGLFHSDGSWAGTSYFTPSSKFN